MTSPSEIGLFAQTACIWEVCARKPGNVNRFHDFADTSLTDFLLSAATLGPVMAEVPRRSVAATVLEAVLRRRSVTSTNTNLGIALLLAPLAKAAAETNFREAVFRIVDNLDVEDHNAASQVYEAIRLANAGGLGEVAEADVRHEPTISLREAMALAAERDLIARQYINGFCEVIDLGVPALVEGYRRTGSVEEAIILCQLTFMSQHPDSLIARKRGRSEAEEAGRRAAAVLAAGWPETPESWATLKDFDTWLRQNGHSRNPGTTADLVTASLFVALRVGSITVTSRFPWRAGTDHDR